jgi:hypothetical protein
VILWGIGRVARLVAGVCDCFHEVSKYTKVLHVICGSILPISLHSPLGIVSTFRPKSRTRTTPKIQQGRSQERQIIDFIFLCVFCRYSYRNKTMHVVLMGSCCGSFSCRVEFRNFRGAAGSAVVPSPNPSLEEDPRLLVKNCKSGRTERRLFSVPYYDTDPFVWVTITWLLCPLHPCIHSSRKEPERCTSEMGPPREAPLDDGEIGCLCNAYDQMRANPETWKTRTAKPADGPPCLTRYIALGFPEVGTIGQAFFVR